MLREKKHQLANWGEFSTLIDWVLITELSFFQTEKEKDATFTSTLETQPLQKTQPLLADILKPKYYVDMMLEAVIVGV